MKTTHTLLTGSCIALAFAFASAGDAVEFHAPAKTKLTKSFATKVEMHSTSMTMTFDGEDAHAGMEAPEVSWTDEETIVVTDEYLAVGKERATKLQRSYDKLAGTSEQKVEVPEGAGEPPDGGAREKSSPLAGKAVVFTWSDDEYSAAWKEGVEGDDALLEGLAGDLDYAGFLPGKSVSDGDTWDLDVRIFRSVFSPGGRLQLRAERDSEEEDEDTADSMQTQIEKNLDGKASAKYRGTREVDGVRLSVIEIEADLKSNATLDEDGGKAAIASTFELEGEVLWDAKAGHLRSFKIAGKMGFSMDSERTIDMGDESHEFTQKLEFEGEVEYRAAFE